MVDERLEERVSVLDYHLKRAVSGHDDGSDYLLSFLHSEGFIGRYQTGLFRANDKAVTLIFPDSFFGQRDGTYCAEVSIKDSNKLMNLGNKYLDSWIFHPEWGILGAAIVGAMGYQLGEIGGNGGLLSKMIGTAIGVGIGVAGTNRLTEKLEANRKLKFGKQLVDEYLDNPDYGFKKSEKPYDDALIVKSVFPHLRQDG